MARSRPPHCRLTAFLTVLTAIAWASAIAPLHAAFSGARDSDNTTRSKALPTSAASGATATALYPGGTSDVRLAATNPNAYPIRVTDIALDGTDADIAVAVGHPACTTTGVSFRHNGRVTIDIAAHGIVETTLDDAVVMSDASVDGCQGATFTIPLILRAAIHRKP